MSASDNANLVRYWWEALNQGKALTIIDDAFAEDYVLHDPTLPAPVRGRQAVRDYIAEIVTAFPDAHYTLDDLIAEGDRVVQRLTVRGTHKGPFMGIPATGKTISVWLIVISRFANGKIVEEWELPDALSMMQQLGVIPAE